MIIFRYKEEPSGKKNELIKRPIADIYIRSKSGPWIEFHPYIDSGADVTLIPLTLGNLIGLKVDEKKIEQIGGIRGSVPAIYSQEKIRIGDNILSARIAWALIEEVPPLLGRTDIFDSFHVTFKQNQGIIIFDERK
ncbi:hypothetical protein HYW54_00280 [Candidatus Gottesmanbacteria bacterium]|nr:hypothetical protein [Candidatus Gottesmanbacteria bacterium]